jgi:hypothetical protein
MKILKKIILLILMMTLGLLADESKWEFTTDDLYTMSYEKKEIFSMAREIGYTYGLGDALVHIAAVETRFGEFKSKNRTHCGAMQVSARWAGTTCKALRDNLYLSMMMAVKNLKNWLDVYDGNMEKALVAYNGGYGYNPHGKEYLRRINQVKYAIRLVEKHGDRIT